MKVVAFNQTVLGELLILEQPLLKQTFWGNILIVICDKFD